MNTLRFCLVLGPILLLLASPVRGETVYVTDTFKITLRTGPSTDNKILLMLSSGDPLELLEQEEGWCRVRVPGREGETAEGWVLSRYLVTRLPWKAQAETLRVENESMRERLGVLERDYKACSEEKGRLAAALRDNTHRLDRLRREHESLKAGARDFLDLKAAYLADRKTLEQARKEIASLRKENDRLASSERTKWFAMGAVVLLCGLMIGVVAGRRRGRRSSLYD